MERPPAAARCIPIDARATGASDVEPELDLRLPGSGGGLGLPRRAGRLRADGADPRLPRSAQAWRGETGQPAFDRQIQQSGAEFIQEVQDRYGALPFPVHLSWGHHDDHIPVSQGRALAEALHADSFTPVPGTAHIVMEDAPEAVVAALLGARDARGRGGLGWMGRRRFKSPLP